MRGGFYAALIEPAGRPGAAALPKGIVDRGERPQATARREVREETGVEAELVADLGAVRYVYTRGGARIFKVVTFYLFRYRRGRIGAIEASMRREVARAWWEPLERVPDRLSYRGERDIARAAADKTASL
jgi:8-oxo-dGTP pyrophosphatase MutT (NUDIX family)